MTQHDFGKCDTCGAPATSLARDHYPIQLEPGDTVQGFNLVDDIKRGCSAHPVESVELERAPDPRHSA